MIIVPSSQSTSQSEMSLTVGMHKNVLLYWYIVMVFQRRECSGKLSLRFLFLLRLKLGKSFVLGVYVFVILFFLISG